MINDARKDDIQVNDSVYNQFIINRGLSLFLDTLAVANEINKYKGISNQMHFDYLRNMVSPRKRFAKWPKPKDHGDASIVSRYYNISMSKAYDMIGIIDGDLIKQMKQELETE